MRLDASSGKSLDSDEHFWAKTGTALGNIPLSSPGENVDIKNVTQGSAHVSEGGCSGGIFGRR